MLLIADHGDRLQLDDELEDAPERRAHVVGFLPVAAASRHEGEAPVLALADTVRPTVVVLSRQAQDDESVVAQVAHLHERGIRVRTLSGFYEEWLGKLPLSELERTSLLFDIRELHRVQYGRVKRVADVAVGIVGLVPLLAALPVVVVGNRFGEPRTAAVPPGTGRQGRSPHRAHEVPDHGARRADLTLDRARRSADHPLRSRSCGSPTSTSCPRCSASSAATSRWSAPDRSSRSTSRSSSPSCPSTTCATSSGPGSPAGPR